MLSIPLRFTYRSLPDFHIAETHIKHMDLPILSQHRKEIERLVKEKHLSPEDALKLLIESHSDDQQAQFQKEEPSLQVTITISGKLISKGDLKETQGAGRVSVAWVGV